MTIDLGLDPALVRGVGLALALLGVLLLLVRRRPSRTEVAALVTATAWAALALLVVNLVALEVGWWSFGVTAGTWHGLPLDLWCAWLLLWGAVPALLLREVPALGVVAGVVALDLLAMPHLAPAVVLGGGTGLRHWLVGELVALVVVLGPSLALAGWTLRGRRVVARAWGQAVWAGGLVLLLPAVALAGDSPGTRDAGVLWWATWAQVLAVVALPAIAAMRELALVGRGTPLPLDPPVVLVTSGPYAYLRNPMQTAAVAVYLVLAVVVGEPVLVLAAPVSLITLVALARGVEDPQLDADFGRAWQRYRADVGEWWPRWRPWPGRPVGTLFVATDCGLCTGVGAWFRARSPVALRVRPAAEHPDVLWRVTYEGAGVRVEGVRAVARALEHLSLGWAMVGWALDLPGVRHAAQLCADAFGAAPRPSRVPHAPGTCGARGHGFLHDGTDGVPVSG